MKAAPWSPVMLIVKVFASAEPAGNDMPNVNTDHTAASNVRCLGSNR